MIWKLLRHNISVWQMVGYAAASLTGLAIVMAAIQFYRDVSGALDSDEQGIGLVSSRNMVISKPVGLSATLSGEAPSFTAEEIDEIKSQPWVGGVASFQAADFSVSAGINFGDRSMHTALFLESVPDSVLDIDLRNWSFDPANPVVPIVISKDYLTLYNFGFASSGRMPMLSEGMLSSVPLMLTVSGNGGQSTLPARIVGYSSWLNTIAVPQAFMDWAHSLYGAPRRADPARLVISVADPSDPTVDSFMTEHDYEVAGAPNTLGRATYFLRLLITVIVVVGVIITLLALGILILSIFLLVQRNRRTIAGLRLLGYSRRQVAACYIRLVVGVNLFVIAVDCALIAIVADQWQKPLAAISIDGSSVWPTLLVGIAAIAAITAVNIAVIRRVIR